MEHHREAHHPEAANRLTALGQQLIETHMGLRDELDRLRDAHLSLADGTRPPTLLSHCVAFCAAVSNHHTDEDVGTFPMLAQRFPALRPVIDELTRDHHLVAGMLRQMQAVVGALPPDPSPADVGRVRTELDSLAALLESHFTYEERKIVAALDALR